MKGEISLFKKRSSKMKRQLKIIMGGVIALISAAMFFLFSAIVPALASMSPLTLEATLAPGESISEIKTVEIPEMPPRADVIFAFDLTGSMGGIINTAKARAIEMMTQLSSLGIDIQFGVVSYMDYPSLYDSYGYANEYGASYCGDYAYRLDQAISNNITAVSNSINALVQGCGSDGPQDYTRIFFESYADSSIGWRPGAKKILVNFGDNVPHDDNLNDGITDGIWSTGGDPGRDEIMFTDDDLDLQAVLVAMKENNVTLIECHTADWPVEWMGGPSGWMLIDYWNYWAGITGGTAYITQSETLINDVVMAITDELVTPMVTNLHLQASSGFESWLVSVEPPSYSGETNVSVQFVPMIAVPVGTVDSTFVFTISAMDDSQVSYGEQTVTIHVVSDQPPDTSRAYASSNCLWPPNHQMVPVQILGVTDPEGDPVTITVTSITSDEPTASDKGSGGSKYAPDASGIGSETAMIRSERSGDGNGRVYVINFTANDGKGGESSGSVAVKVPHDQSSKDCTAIDSGQNYDATKIN